MARQFSDSEPTIWVAIPAMDERDNLKGLIGLLKKQTWKKVRVFVCINQPDSWWDRPDKREVCINNQQSLVFLKSITNLEVVLVDKSSRGRGWSEKKGGVGWARKVLMDTISREAHPGDILISLDADTTFSPGYFRSVVNNFKEHPRAVALAVPYYHKLVGEPVKDRAILRYEIYMRYYATHMWNAESPYSFTALGSAIALPVNSYHTIGGITPYPGGEDFYFVQKLLKYGPLLVWNEEKVYPETRYSDRVGFGTGPAMQRGTNRDWSAYPLYPQSFFESIKQTIRLYSELFNKTVPTPMDAFFVEKFKTLDPWDALRKNTSTEPQFIRACHTKIDGLRTLQYLKWRHQKEKQEDSEALLRWFDRFDPEEGETLLNGSFSFDRCSVELLDSIRNRLVAKESSFQKRQPVLHL